MLGQRLLVCVAVCLLVSVSLFAQQSASTANPTTSDPQAVAAMQNSVTVLTGSAPITNVTMSGTVTVNLGSSTAAGTITMTANAAGQSQITVALPSGNWVTTANYSANPRTSATTGPNGAVHNSASEEVMGPSPAWFCPALLINAATSANYVSSDRGQEVRNGSTVHHISIWPQSSANLLLFSSRTTGRQVLTGPNFSPPIHVGQEELYLDPSTALPQELDLPVRAYKEKNGTADLTQPIPAREVVQYSDYQNVRGHLVPLRINVSASGISITQVQVSSVQFNSQSTATD
ncbi:MAG: hypothetical protein ACRD4X_01990 [Candidatus Acidiferrales bacterium]